MTSAVPQVMSNLGFALAYAKRGWPVFPLHTALPQGRCSCGEDCQHAGKHPRTKQGFKDASTDEAQIRRWWQMWPDASIGIATGERSGLCVIDIDPRSGGDATWQELVLTHDPLPMTPNVITGWGGDHLYWQMPKGRGPVRSKAHKLGKGVDVKASGGYVVAPPSTHHTGNTYRFREGAGPGDFAPAQMPDWLTELVCGDPRPSRPPPPTGPAKESGWMIVAFEAAGWLGRKLSGGKYAATCPWSHLHTGGKDKDSSSVVFPPSAQYSMGHFHCSHSHCAHRSQRDVRDVLPPHAAAAANAAFPPLMPDVDGMPECKVAYLPEPPPRVEQPVEPADPTDCPIDPGEVVGDDDEDWESNLIRRKDGSLVSNHSNAISILAHDARWRGVIGWNEFTYRVDIRKPPPWHRDDAPAQSHDHWQDEDSVRLVSWYERVWSLKVGREIADSAAAVVAHRNAYHPVRKYLDGLRWDTVQRLPHWLATYLGAEDSDYHSAIGMRWMIAMVARVFAPGCKVDSILILEGKQGSGKSTALKTLVGAPWFADSIGDLASKDSADALVGKLLIELGELASVRKADAETLKSFLSRQIDHYRPAYGRHTIDRPRQCVFAGSTNLNQYITDETGARRFWGCRVGTIDMDAIARDREQLLAEAVVRYTSGERWHLEPNESRAQVLEQDRRVDEDPWAPNVLEWVEGMERARTMPITIENILAHALSIEPGRRTQQDSRRVGKILRRIGYEVTSWKGPRGARAKVWSASNE